MFIFGFKFKLWSLEGVVFTGVLALVSFMSLLINIYLQKLVLAEPLKQLQYIFRDSNNERKILTQNCNISNQKWLRTIPKQRVRMHVLSVTALRYRATVRTLAKQRHFCQGCALMLASVTTQMDGGFPRKKNECCYLLHTVQIASVGAKFDGCDRIPRRELLRRRQKGHISLQTTTLAVVGFSFIHVLLWYIPTRHPPTIVFTKRLDSG